MDQKVCVIDNGSGSIKAGLESDDEPSVTFPTIVGRTKGSASAEYVGEQAKANRGSCNIFRPIQHGIITNWDDMELVWSEAFKQVGVTPEETPVLLDEVALNDRANREKMATIMFETFNVPKFSMALQAVLSLYASGRTDGLVIDSGTGKTHIVPVRNMVQTSDAVQKLGVAGADVTRYLKELLKRKGTEFEPSTEMEIIHDIKEKVAFVAENAAEEAKKGASVPYTLPDGKVIQIGNERFGCVEAMFNASVIGVESGLVGKVIKAVKSCEEDFRKTLYGNVVLAGGNTMFPGFKERLYAKIAGIIPEDTRVKVIATPERVYSAWIGGSIYGSLSSTKDNMFITKAEYNEAGASIVHQKCPV